MTQHDDIKGALRKAAIDGDVKKLETLANSFPVAFEELRYSDLVDLSAANHHSACVLYLTIKHGFEVSTNFETAKKCFGGESMFSGLNELQQTLEVMCDAAFDFHYEEKGRGMACYKLRDVLNAAGLDISKANQHLEDSHVKIHPAFIQLAKAGAVYEFANGRMKDERLEMCGSGRHFVNALRAMAENEEALIKADELTHYDVAEIETANKGIQRQAR